MLKKWEKLFAQIKQKEYAQELTKFLDYEYSHYVVFPPRNRMFASFDNVAPEDIKVIILGQDPYHEKGQAMGLSFSVPVGIELPPSLVNIYKEIENEYKFSMNYKSGDLTYLAKQGCLLLNTLLSVREHQALSHNIKEYNLFIIDVLNYIDALNQPIVFMLWGNNAKQYIKYIKNSNRLILTSVHPSPLSANRGGWFDNGHFKKANEYLKAHNVKEINWLNN